MRRSLALVAAALALALAALMLFTIRLEGVAAVDYPVVSGSVSLIGDEPEQPPTLSPALAYVAGALACIRGIESGGDYGTDTGNGYHGAYQFLPSTWREMGGAGNPALAPEEEQDLRAARLLVRRGLSLSSWPTPSRRCA